MEEAKKYYPLFGVFGNVALICAGTFSKRVAGVRAFLDKLGVARENILVFRRSRCISLFKR